MLYKLSKKRQEKARDIVIERLTVDEGKKKGAWKDRLSQLMIHPIWGVPILALVLWFGLYKFVGEFGAGTMVDFIETNIFESIINPKVDAFFSAIFGSNMFFDLFAGEYGVITLGLRYAIAIIFPIVGTFFIAFSIIEDTGYLPRLAMLVDRIFKKIGLSGRAVIPLTLGFGCDTMATIVTRTLETTKERVIATFLLSLAIPCSAQLGVLLGLMAGNPMMLFIWILTVVLIFMLSGFLAKRLIKGEDTSFFMELPPLRLPTFINVFTKTYTRMVWYFKEVIPLFILASVVIWFGKLTGIFDFLVRLMSYPVTWAGMPEGASHAFLYGFFRRDFGAAGLFELAKDGLLAGNSLLIAAVVLTFFVPCVAQFAITWKER
ncbi:MAG: nucleoside recognition domain-containing protein, partial [Candidatus Omnitrophota bacterium]|nr:nucleoside recognition domain-containing protein [Candidatus Omnitrophota bacterium]